jgi:hypothetical protein
MVIIMASMYETKIFATQLNDLFIDTIQKCTFNLLNENDETIEYNLFEEFDLGATPFLHENSLNMLVKYNYINEEIKELSSKLREKFMSMDKQKRNAKCVRKDEDWHDILKLGDLIWNIKNEFDFKNNDKVVL